jgi:hypothetical protein
MTDPVISNADEKISRAEMVDWLARHRRSAELMAAGGPLPRPTWDECSAYFDTREEFDAYAAGYTPEGAERDHRECVIRLAVIEFAERAMTVLRTGPVS